MSQIKQAACPSCKAVLRIPTEWVGQAIRCKACGATVHTRVSSSSRPAPPPPPPPPPRKPTTPPPPRAAARGNVFDFDEADDGAPARRRRRRGGGWVALSILTLLLGAAAALGYHFWDQISERVPGTSAHAQREARREKEKEKEKEQAPAATGMFPRRALVISVHNYLYANPLPVPTKDDPGIWALVKLLGEKLKIDDSQLVHLSDAAEKEPRPPLKGVIREALSNFLKTSRAQDRLLVFFIGHTAEVDGEVYLVPLEGELTDAKNLIPLKDVLAEMGKCPARQKVLVLDGNRHSPSQGEDRPSSGPMGEKLEALLKSPPAGVQVLASCGKGQRSYEFTNSNLGAFLNALRMALDPKDGEKGAVEGQIQARDDFLPLEALHQAINVNLTRQIDRFAPQEGEGEKRHKATQVAMLTGRPPADGAAHDPAEAPAPAPAITPPRLANAQLIRGIMRDISLPPLKGGDGAALDVAADQLPPFPEEALKKYEDGDLPADSPVRKAIHEARVLIWGVSSATPPAELEKDVRAFRQKLGTAEGRMLREVGKGETADKPRLDNRLRANSLAMSKIIHRFEMHRDTLEALAKAGLADLPPRWRATFDLVRGRFLAQLAYLEEYQNVIGQMLKEVPPAEANHTGWRIAAKKKAGDSTGRKYDKQAQTLFRGVTQAHADTPWDVVARREMLNNLGLEWQAY